MHAGMQAETGRDCKRERERERERERDCKRLEEDICFYPVYYIAKETCIVSKET